MNFETINQRREELRKETEGIFFLQQQVQDAQNSEDYLFKLPHFQLFHRRGVDAIIRSYQRCPDEYVDWVFDLTQRNMKPIYQSAWGWNDAAKQQELYEESARYLIAVCGDKPIGFVHFRFEQQNGEFVLYIYDLQVEHDFQGRGLGRFLADACWFIGMEKKVSCVITLVYKANEEGINFFRNVGYLPHPMSPEQLYPEKEKEYQQLIIHRPIKRRRTAEANT